MKVEFKHINHKNIHPGSVFFLYGNYKRTFGVFCDFVFEQFLKEFMDVDIFYVSVAECMKIISNQCDLFGTKINCFCIRNVEDNHLEKLSPFLSEKKNIFILESGDYGKSKKISDFFTKSSDFLAIASFKNDITMQSLCKMMVPTATTVVCNEIMKLINNTDEDLSSLFKKVSLLMDENDSELLKQYSVYKSSFLEDIDIIPLVRFLLQAIIKEKILGKSQSYLNLNLSGEKLIEKILFAEVKQKQSVDIPKSYIYNLIT